LLHYQAYLLYPTIIGIAWLAWFGYRFSKAPTGVDDGDTDSSKSEHFKYRLEYALDSEVNVFIGLIITLWATLFVESWKRKQRTI